jgi:hypothetical protein
MALLPYFHTLAAVAVAVLLGIQARKASEDDRHLLLFGYSGLAVASFAMAVVGFATWPNWR